MNDKVRKQREAYRKKKNKRKAPKPDATGWSALAFMGHQPDIARMEGPHPEIWRNHKYQVARYPAEDGKYGRMVHLSIKRIDRQPIHDWRDLQKIKNEMVGPESEAMEIYPAESRLVDSSNQYHLWCLLDMKIPFGFKNRLVSDSNDVGAVNRKFDEAPPDNIHLKSFEHAKSVVAPDANGKIADSATETRMSAD